MDIETQSLRAGYLTLKQSGWNWGLWCPLQRYVFLRYEWRSFSLSIHLGTIHLTSEAWIARRVSHSESGREDSFRNGIRTRDGRCVITGQVNLLAPYRWTGFEAAHIFPLEKETLWRQSGYGRWITNIEEGSGINSTQNGLLMLGHLHTCFDQYLFSVNPDVSTWPFEPVLQY